MKRPYTLFRRKPGKVWYYRLPDKPTAHSTGKTVRAQAEQFVLSILNGNSSTGGKREITLQQFATNFFVAGKCKWMSRRVNKGRLTTKEIAQMRRGHLHNYLFPAFGGKPMGSISLQEIDDWLAQLPLANTTKNHIIDTVRIVWTEAEYQGVLSNSPMDQIERYGKNPKTRDVFTMEELHTMFPRQIDRIVAIWGSLQHAVMFLVLATTGTREGEVRALTWADWVRGEGKDKGDALSVTKAIKNDESVGSTKSKTARVVLLTSHARDMLTQLHSVSESTAPDSRIFADAYGSPPSRRLCMVLFGKALVNASIDAAERNLVVHSFRHTFNTIYRPALGDEVLQKMIGHSSTTMTDHYDHPEVPDMIRLLEGYRSVLDNTWEPQEETALSA